MLSEAGCRRGEGLPQPPMVPASPQAPASTAACGKPGHCSALPAQGRAGTFTCTGFRLLSMGRCLLPSKGHWTREPHSLPGSAQAAAGTAPARSPVCSGREMCILQLVLTTDRPPASRAETMGPSAGSFSMRSLTSCVPKSGDRGVWHCPHPTPPIQRQGTKPAPRGDEVGLAQILDPGTPCKSSSKRAH